MKFRSFWICLMVWAGLAFGAGLPGLALSSCSAGLDEEQGTSDSSDSDSDSSDSGSGTGSERRLSAPESLAWEKTAAGLALSWEDCSHREEGYVVIRQRGEADAEEFFLPANSTSWVDVNVDKGRYSYSVMSYYRLERSEAATCVYEYFTLPSVSAGTPELSSYMASVPILLDDDGGENCAVGICWSQAGTPTLDDSVYEFRGDPPSEPYGNVTSMLPGEEYFVRAWATNSQGTVYSQTLPVELLPQPEPLIPEWTEILSYALPSSLKLYYTSTEVTGRLVNAWYAVADLSMGELELRTMKASSLKTPSQFVSEDLAGETVWLIVNGGYFDAVPQSYSYVLDRGVQQATNIRSLTRTKTYPVTRGAFGVTESGVPSVKWIYSASDSPWAYDKPLPVVDGEAVLQPTASFPDGAQVWPVYSAIGGGPVILKDGRLCFDYLKTAEGRYKTNYELLQSDIFGPSVRPPRTAIGHTADGRIVLMVVDGRGAGGSQGVSLDELARLMAGVGCTDALNLDGGGSSAMCVTSGAELLNSPSDGSQRRVLSFVSLVGK